MEHSKILPKQVLIKTPLLNFVDTPFQVHVHVYTYISHNVTVILQTAQTNRSSISPI